jgi:branched-subunit amino acid transport protein
MTAAWVTIGGLAVATAAIKAFGPLVFGGRDLHPVLARVIPLLAPALLAALVVTQTFGSDRALVLDARAGGLVVAGAALWLRAPLYVVVLGAAAATAVLRALA